ncbi:MAG: hypothetical protein QGH15_20620 [Kiritimatiellia bacterium]|nr:hypothetical protein [Kiritimatiellia bacterium]
MYIRNEKKWSGQEVNPEEDTDAPQKRLAQLTGTAAFQANYECFQPETVLLEDHYNERSGSGGGIYGSHRDDRILFDGVLIGNPGFTYDGAEEGAFTFNGKNQWAEMPGEMADLEIITLDMRLKIDSNKKQTLWMFGNDEQNHLSLSLAGGQLVLAGNAGDVRADCRGGKVSPGVWTVVRAELDGKTMKLFQDGKNIAEIKTDFRSSDAFAPGKVRLATMAAGLGGTFPMTGAVDYLRVLSEVYEDFSKVDVPLVNPRRICPKVYARFKKEYIDTDYEAKREAFSGNLAKTHPLTAYYAKYAAAVGKRKEELSASAAERIKEINNAVEALKDRKDEIYREINEARKNDEAYNKLVAKLRPRQQEIHKKQREMQESYPGYKEAIAAEDELHRQRNELRKTAEAECKKDPEYIALEERIKEQRKKINAAPQGSSERRKLEEDLNHKMHRAKNEMINQRQAKLPGVRELERERKKVQGHREQLDRAIRETAAYKKSQKENDSLQRQMRYKPDPKLDAERKKLDRDIHDIPRREIGKAQDVAAAETNALEAQLLRKSGWSGQLAKISKTILSGHTPHIPDDVAQLETARKLQALPWPTTVDWDGRARYESDKEAMAQPVMQHYLKRMKPWMYE